MPDVYVDTSALGRVLLGEPDADAVLRELADFDRRVSSRLMRIELRRLGLRHERLEAAGELADSVALVPLDEPVLELAEAVARHCREVGDPVWRMPLWKPYADALDSDVAEVKNDPDAWAQALQVLGEHDTSIVVAAILQRGDEIKSAGGYLRVLTAKAKAGEFSLGPVLMALLRGKAAKAARERKKAG